MWWEPEQGQKGPHFSLHLDSGARKDRRKSMEVSVTLVQAAIGICQT